MNDAETMVREQLLPPHRGINNPAVLEAMRIVPREAFVPSPQRNHAYGDHALPLAHGQTISQPFIVAYMSEAAFPAPTHRALEIGTGSGYQTAVLAQLVDAVYTIERIPALSNQAQSSLAELGYRNIHFRIDSGYNGWPQAAPFDLILVTCAAPTLPETLVSQLRIGGKLIIPIGQNKQALYRITRQRTGYKQEALLDVSFVPMVDSTISPDD